MKALNAASLTPVSVLSQTRTVKQQKSVVSQHPTSKFSSFASLNKTPQTLHGGLVLLSSIFSTGLAKPLTYEEALQQSTTSEFDSSGVLDGFINFATENPLVIAGGVAVLAVPLVLSQVFKEQKTWGVESARKAYSVLGEDDNAQLVDIRAPVEIRQVGSPDLSGLRKRPVSVVYKGEDKPGFLKRLSSKFKEPENTTLFILDKSDGNSELVAELVAMNGFNASYAIKDGAEGPRGWIKSGLPWSETKKALSFDLSSLTDGIGAGDVFPVTLGVAAAAGLGFFAFTELETILQLLGSAATMQLVGKKLLFAEDRKKTVQQVDEFLNTKIAPKELVDDIKQIGNALLPTMTGKALPAPAEASSEAGIETSPVQKTEAAAPAPSTEPKLEASVEPTLQINSVPKTEVKEESVSSFSKPLSPYPAYPDFKPPTSPRPSQP